MDIPFTHNGISYPANWLRLSTAKEKKELGITEITPQPRPDDRFYWVADNGDGTYTTTPKPVDLIQTMLINQINQYAYSALLKTDWMVVRKAETGTEIPAEISEYRADLRAAFDENESAILSCTSVTQLESLEFNWPLDPSSQQSN